MARTTAVELVVLGPVDALDLELAEMGVHRTVACTLLETTVRDQAALYGLLQRLSALGLELLELRTAHAGDPPEVAILVRGPVGALARGVVVGDGRSTPGTLSAGPVEGADLARLLATAWERSSTPAVPGGERPVDPGERPVDPDGGQAR
ncbi:hypothetical protein [Cellulosimicrobium sp. CUA-896]|uniref:hypothetical protein n=1 Tax=Cellulosimicrobium sp. CUA-896 TaxID=1517881 RepID=UPI0011153B20|nr:hypothetical protein [Cellulosimicrobium sp. CUA-896]